MGIVTQISVGDIMYYQVDDIPSHTAPKGSVSVMSSGTTYSNGFTYVNNDGGTTWLKCISSSYGEISLSDATNVIDFNSQTIGSFYSFNATPTGGSWVLNTNSSDDWILATENANTDDLKYTGSTTMRAFVSLSTTVRGGPEKWVSHNITTAQNFSVITTSVNQYYSADNGATVNCGHNTIREVGTDDYFICAISPVVKESGGDGGGPAPAARSYISKHAQISAIKIDEPLISTQITTLIDEDWETGSLSGWTVVNDTTNQWEIGTAQVDTGTYGVYGSNDGGTTANYSNVGDVSHFYQDVTIPADATNVTLTFVWRSFMENAGAATQYDYGTINIIDTTTTPVAGTEVSTALATGGGNGRVNETGANDGKFNENYKYGGTYDGTWFTETIDLSAYAGTTKRLVFTVKDDGAAPNDAPAMSIDNILLTYGGGIVY
jgi:hypothetical protein